MASPTKAANYFPSAIIVPSLTANDYAITPATTQTIGAMKTAVLAKSGALHFDVDDTLADFVLHSATTEHVDGVTYNNMHKERLMKVTIVAENNPAEGSTGEAARTTLLATHGNLYDVYLYDDTERTNSYIRKLVGVVFTVTEGETPGEKPIVTLTGQVRAEADSTDNFIPIA